VSIPEPVAEEIQVRAVPEKVEAAVSQTTPLSKTRWFRPVLIFVGAIALILVGVWLTSSGILSADDKTDVVDTESVAGLSTEIPQATNTSAAVFVPATASVTDTPQPPSSTVTSEPPPEPAYPAISTSEGPGMGLNTVVFLGFDGVTPPFNNVLVRRAIASSIDRVGLINVMADLLPNYTLVPATNITPPDYLGFDLYGEVGYPFDVDMARQLMAEAGYPNGEGFPAITLFHGASEGAAELARQVSEDLHGFLGISVNVSSFQINYLDLPAFYTIGWRADYINPHSFLYDPFCGNYNAEFLQSDKYSELVDSINVERNFDIRADKIREYSDTWCDGVWDPHLNLGQEYKRIVDQALEERDFGEARMLYVEAEIMLVETEAFIVPLYHRTN
jgi:ABC-type transport system substrate-binding protein